MTSGVVKKIEYLLVIQVYIRDVNSVRLSVAADDNMYKCCLFSLRVYFGWFLIPSVVDAQFTRWIYKVDLTRVSSSLFLNTISSLFHRDNLIRTIIEMFISIIIPFESQI